jgi:hypothetical protein
MPVLMLCIIQVVLCIAKGQAFPTLRLGMRKKRWVSLSLYPPYARLEGLQELCSCEGFYLQRILYYQVNIGHSVRSAIVFAEKMPLYLQKTDPKTKRKEVILFQEPACS